MYNWGLINKVIEQLQEESGSVIGQNLILRLSGDLVCMGNALIGTSTLQTHVEGQFYGESLTKMTLDAYKVSMKKEDLCVSDALGIKSSFLMIGGAIQNIRKISAINERILTTDLSEADQVLWGVSP